jgi:hypothetical protein
MKALILPIIRKQYSAKIGKTVIECNHNGSGTITVFANGDQSSSNALLANIVVNEPGDTFIAGSDSKTMDSTGKKPLFKKGETVVRKVQSYDFKSFAGDNTATQFAQGASAFGLQLNVIMQA